MTYDLSTLRLGTRYDAPQGAAPLGEPLRDGNSPAVVLIEGGRRASGRLLRALRADLLVGLRVPEAAGAGQLRVDLVLVVDQGSWRHWADDHAETHGGTTPDVGTHRLLTITAQGVPRAACLLVPDESGTTRQRVTVVLDADEIGRDGLLVLGLEDTPVPADWAAPLAGGAIGVVIAKVVVEPVGTGVAPRVSTGRPPAAGARPTTSIPPGFLVANPGLPGATVALRLHTPKPKPARIEAVDVAGQQLLGETLAPNAHGAIEVPLGSLDRSALVRAVDPRSGVVRRAYQVGVLTHPADKGRR